MGVSGCGKTAVGSLLAQQLGARFIDADDLHPQANVEKMRAGMPLDDADRAPWLALLNGRLRDARAAGEPVVLACSALKQRYRDQLAEGVPGLRFVHLAGSRDLIAARLAARRHRYMPARLLDSQFATLEPPADAIVLDVALPLGAIVEQAAQGLAVE
jgi:gluconokinase